MVTREQLNELLRTLGEKIADLARSARGLLAVLTAGTPPADFTAEAAQVQADLDAVAQAQESFEQAASGTAPPPPDVSRG